MNINKLLKMIYKKALEVWLKTGDKIFVHHFNKTATLHVYECRLDYWIELDQPGAEDLLREALEFMNRLEATRWMKEVWNTPI